jgi:hypothetical protein
MKLRRTGDLFEAFGSADGITWTPVGSITLAIPHSAVVGVAIYSATTATWATGNFDNVHVTHSGSVDSVLPSVTVTAPANGSTVSGTIAVSATASDNVGVVGVQFKQGTTNIGAEDTSSPYSVSWNTTTVANGSYTLTAVARDAAGNTTTSGSITVTVNNDTTAPTVSITAPANGATVSGTVSLTATAGDNVGVVGVQFKQGTTNIGAEDTTAPYLVSWDSTTVANGSYTLTAVARDAAGNSTTSVSVTVTVSNTDTAAPTVSITAPAGGASVQGSVTVSANATDNVGVVGVLFKVDGNNIGAEDTTAPYSLSWDTTGLSNGSHALTAVARDAAGNSTTSSTVTVTVNNPDTTAPTVALTGPANGATVSGTVSVTATASDNIGVVGVQFKQGTTNIGSEDTISPYSASWNTTTVANGTYTLTAIARDAANNTTTSAAITVTVNNPDTTPPTVSITAPNANARVRNAVTVTATASDNIGVVGVQFRVDGMDIGAEDTTAPYSISWDTTTVSNGSHVLTAVARDAAGNTQTSANRTVRVSNNAPAPAPAPAPDDPPNDATGVTALLGAGSPSLDDPADVVVLPRRQTERRGLFRRVEE